MQRMEMKRADLIMEQHLMGFTKIIQRLSLDKNNA